MVLWPDSGWKVLGMDKMQDPKKVQLYFRKALLVVHPDKQPVNCDSDRRFISNSVFAALNDAFAEFKTEPGVNL